MCQGLAVSTGSNLTGECVIIPSMEGIGPDEERLRKSGGSGWMEITGINGHSEGRCFAADRLRQVKNVTKCLPWLAELYGTFLSSPGFVSFCNVWVVPSVHTTVTPLGCTKGPFSEGSGD